MKLQTIYLAYTILTPEFDNPYSTVSHQIIIKILRDRFFSWKPFFEKYQSDFSLGFYISLKKGTEKLTIFGPSISKKMKIVDFSVFLPDEIKDLNHYIDLAFEGFGIVLAKFKVDESEILEMKNECKRELNLV
jgi:hypothetical protein